MTPAIVHDVFNRKRAYVTHGEQTINAISLLSHALALVITQYVQGLSNATAPFPENKHWRYLVQLWSPTVRKLEISILPLQLQTLTFEIVGAVHVVGLAYYIHGLMTCTCAYMATESSDMND